LTTLATLTPNTFATARVERPSATDATTRSRRSIEYDPSMLASLSSQHLESELASRGNP